MEINPCSLEMVKARAGEAAYVCCVSVTTLSQNVTKSEKERRTFIKVSTTHEGMYYLVHNLVKRDREALVRLFCEGRAVEGVTSSVLLVKNCL